MLLAVLPALLIASAAEADPAVLIEHQPPGINNGGLEAKIVSTAGRKIFEPAAFVRDAGTSEYLRLPMEALPADLYRVALPASLQGRECEYFLEAFDEDGNGPFRQGSPEQPLHLAVVRPPERAPAAATALASPARRPRRTAGIALLASGAALVIGGAISGALALSDFHTEQSTADPSVYDHAKSSAQTESRVADALYGVGAAAAVAGAVLWLLDARAPSPVSIGAAPAPGGACAVLNGRF